jgi:hypothetical protein
METQQPMAQKNQRPPIYDTMHHTSKLKEFARRIALDTFFAYASAESLGAVVCVLV